MPVIDVETFGENMELLVEQMISEHGLTANQAREALSGMVPTPIEGPASVPADDGGLN